ncbi:MAG TPA: ABC transporter ATP-binding protein [Aestuariivirga sp.]|nr:ABC transporter ATP-binding protein [Alphaproteobacteria bacterium]HRX36106.1 ABC transporter ATP-binding protein [Aestuariivirga sp.]
MADENAVFRLDGVTRSYGNVTALRNVSLAVAGNEYVSLLGPSGSGKSTLLRVIAGFEPPNQGRVYFQGRDITNIPSFERGIGFVFQNFALFPHLSVFDNVAFGLANGAQPVAKAEIDERVRHVIDLVGLSGLEDRGVNQISGGQKQRVALARTLVMAPKLVLLDEPLGALDANLRHRMRVELRAIREKLGVTFLHVTGSETEALAMGDRVVVLDRGSIAQFAPPADVYDHPATPNVAHFLNRYNMFDGSLKDGQFAGPFGSIPITRVTPADRTTYAIRYDRIRVMPKGQGAAGPAIDAKFVASEYLGSSVMYFFETADRKVVEVEHHLSLGAPETYAPMQHYDLCWKAEDALVFGQG